MPFYSIVAGFFGAFASVFGKLAFSSDSLAVKYIEDKCQQLLIDVDATSLSKCSIVVYTFRAIMFCVMMGVNAVMLSSAVRALHADGSLKSTVMTTSVNFVATAIFAYLLFGEDLSMTWWVGAAFIFFGVYFVQKGKSAETSDTVKAKDE